MEKLVKAINENNFEFQFIGIIVAVFCVILTLVLVTLWRRRKSAGNSILITGLSDAGKTILFSRLLNSKFISTYTSVKENTGNIYINNHSLRIVDIPGHERLRYKYFDKYKSSARALVYVIDAVTLQKDIRDVAEFLYSLLSIISIQRHIPILVLCNKQDQTMAKGCGVIKTLLEKEINLLRLTKSSQLEAIDDSSSNTFLGKNGVDFEFNHLNMNVQFAESSAYNKDSDSIADIEELSVWLKKIV
ncbi:signal recognition particle receptor subunit beta [Leptopilina heterotoma]|uniref:signal recognition particle receptor subunit beta n=1 Tax=Leptopilina heterotoma TaxID=63436 RepID=UPI001CA85FEE|nr:signal recognition particle receptor subunit beta [Leptopilina heterotoma]